jgi:hypothetical protein
MGSWYTCEGGGDWVSLAPPRTRGKESLLGTVLQGEKISLKYYTCICSCIFQNKNNSSLMRIGLVGETDPCDTQTEMRYVNPLTTTGCMVYRNPTLKTFISKSKRAIGTFCESSPIYMVNLR